MKTYIATTGRTHKLAGITIYTGQHSYGKYAGFSLPSMPYVPACIFKRNDAAKIIRHDRKTKKDAN
jgi:hypothetical protein